MEDELEFTPLDLLAIYSQAGAFLETRIARLKAAKQDFEGEEATSDLLALGVCAIVSEYGPQVVIEPEEGPVSFAS